MKSYLPILAFFLLLGLAPAPAQAQATGQSCAQIDEEARRLLCYDLVFRRSSTTTPILGQLPPSQEIDAEVALLWPMTTMPAPNGQGMLISITTLSPAPISESDQFAKLTIACFNAAPSVQFWFPGYFMGSDTEGRQIKVTIDNIPQQTLATSGADSMMTLAGGAKTIPLIQQMIDGNRITVSAKPTSGPPIKAYFDLKGLSQAIGPLRNACDW